MNPILTSLVIVVILVLAYLLLRWIVSRAAERFLFKRKPNGIDTPASFGMAFEDFTIPNDGHDLQAWYVPADPKNDAHKAILIYHGVYECLSEWVPALHYLWMHGVSTMIFDYTGCGEAAGRVTLATLRQDVQSAWQSFQSKAGPGYARFALGLSLGSGCLLDGLAQFQAGPDRILLVAGFSSLREAAASIVHIPNWLSAQFVPDVFNNLDLIRQLRVPLLIVHSRADELLPLSMAERLYAAAGEPKRLVVVEGLQHNAMLEGRSADYLAPVVETVLGIKSGEGD